MLHFIVLLYCICRIFYFIMLYFIVLLYCICRIFYFIKKETLAQVFSCEFCKISKSTFPHRTPLVAASDRKTNDDLK